MADAPEVDSLAADISAAISEVEAAGAEPAAGSAAPDPAPSSSDAGAAPAASAAGAPGPAGTPAAPAALEAPKHWPDDKKALFAKQPRETQEYLLERMSSIDSEFTKRNEELAPVKQMREQMEGVLGPYRHLYQQDGLDDVGAIKNLVESYNYLRNNPTEALKRYAEHFKVDLGQLAGTPAGEGFTDPAAESPVVRQLQQQLAAMQGHFQNFSQAQQQSAQQEKLRTIQAFADEKDAATGQPLRPHFSDVSNEMTGLFKAGMAKDLHDAYEKAIRLNPEVWSRAQAAQAEAAAKAAEDKRKAEVAEAKRAGFSVVGSGAQSESGEAEDLRAEILRNWDKNAA